jgi:hypothetical protein
VESYIINKDNKDVQKPVKIQKAVNFLKK